MELPNAERSRLLIGLFPSKQYTKLGLGEKEALSS